MTQPSLEQRRQAFTDLEATANVEPVVLRDTAWEVIGDILYEPDKADAAQLLPWAYVAMERVAEDPALRARGHDTYFDARTAIACWDVFMAIARGAPAFGDIQKRSAGKLGSIIADTVPDYNVAALPDGPRNKLHQIMTLALLQRSAPNAGLYGVPSAPLTHSPEYYEEDGTTTYHMHAITARKTVPIFVASASCEMNSAYRVLPIMLGGLLISSAAHVPAMLADSVAQGDLDAGRLWLTDQIAYGLAYEHDGVQAPLRALLNTTSYHIGRLVAKFDPDVIAHVLLNKRDAAGQGFSGFYSTDTPLQDD